MTPSKLALSSFVVLAALLCGTPSSVHAQDRAVISQVAEYGQMSSRVARQVVRSVDRQLSEDAARGGDSYNELRQQVNQAIFADNPGPGATREEYNSRLAQVLSRMNRGMNLEVLGRLFAPGANAAALCAHKWGLTMGACDALIAAASQTPVAFPYLAPDDGRALLASLRGERAARTHARGIVSALSEVMLGVPGNLENNAAGRRLLALLQACPGGITDRSAQIRAWHVGPTEGLARCIGRTGGARSAQELFGMSSDAARAFAAWAGAETGSAQANNTQTNNTNTRTNTNTNTRNNTNTRTHHPAVVQMSDVQALRNQAAAFARARRYENAAAAYQAALRADDTHVPTLLAYGDVQLHLGNPAAGLEAIQRAVSLDDSDSNTFVSLGRAYAQNGQRDEAIEALRHAMTMDYDNWEARRGLDALGGEVPPPPLPERPSRETVIGVMQPLIGAISDCDTRFTGNVRFSVTVWGRTGEVLQVSSEGEMSEDARFCMEAVVQSANFPRFVQEEFNVVYPYSLEASAE